MTDTERNHIATLRCQGLGYQEIAQMLDVPVGTLKAYLHRHPLSVCEVCGKAVISVPHKRSKRFCSAECRLAWWNSHPELVQRGEAYVHICEGCGQKFHSHKASSRFCSRQCYASSRQKGVGA